MIEIVVYGSPAPQAALPATLPAHIRRNIELDPSGCWLWTRSRSSDGYGWASLANRTHQAHRLVFTLLRGEPPAGTVLDHLCRVRHCVNPDHLEPVTNRENLARSMETTTGMEVCKLGHPLSPMKWQRRCPTCLAAYEAARAGQKRAYLREYRQRRKAAP